MEKFKYFYCFPIKMEQKNKAYERKANRSFPKHLLEEAMTIAQEIQDKNAGKPMKRLLVADAIGRKPTSVQFRDLLSSSFKYGLTIGTEKAEFIELTELGKNLTKPTSPEIGMEAKQNAVTFPGLFKNIYNHYKDSKFPRGTFFENNLEVQFKVPREYVQEVAKLLEANGKFAGVIRNISGSPHIIFDDLSKQQKEKDDPSTIEENGEQKTIESSKEKTHLIPTKEKQEKETLKPIFVAHGKNKKPLEQLKKILDQFKIPYKIAIDEPHSGRPISKKVKETMRECGSAIFIFSESGEPIDGEKVLPNINVVYELGAASVIYDDKIVIFKEEKVNLPSDFSDLGYISFSEDNLEAKAMDLLKELIQLGFVKIAPVN